MRLFSYEEFRDIHTRASDEGYNFDDALHRSLIVAVHKFLEYHNLKSDLVTEKNLVGDAIKSYKKKLQLWRSHEATCRLVLFNLNYTVARLDPSQQPQEEQRAGSCQGETVYGPFRPGKYAFPNHKYPRTSYTALPRTYTPPKQAYPNPFDKPFKPAETGKYASPKPEYSGNSVGSFKPAETAKYAFPDPEFHDTTPHSPRDPRHFKEFRESPTSPHWKPRQYPSTYTAKSYTSSYTKPSTSTNPPPPRRPDSPNPWTHSQDPNASDFHPRPGESSSWHPPNNGDAEFFSCRPQDPRFTTPPRPKTPPPPPPPPPPARFSGSPDLYKVLCVSRAATAMEIRTAYRKLSLKHHPDRVGEAEKGKATVKMAEINQAYDVLGDEEARRYYDVPGRVKK
jgi:hypothetical protein